MQLRDYQAEAVESVFQYYNAGNDGNPVIAKPTGTGKSIVIAGLIMRIMMMYPTQRVIVATHDKRLIEQNAAKLRELWPVAPIGIYSAGLSQRDTAMPVIFGGIASMVNCIDAFGWRDLLFVDECHLISNDENTMYQSFIAGLKKVNPHLKVIGLSATPYRLGQGLLTDGGIFTDVCFDATGVEAFNRFISEGYLSPLIARPTTAEINVDEIHIRKGEFVTSEAEEAAAKIMLPALKELVEFGYSRRAWLIFASGVKGCELAAEILTSFGIPVAPVHSKLTQRENDKRIAAYKRGELAALINAGMLTTGFDHPPIDLIGSLRVTTSPGLHVQMLGRGTRPVYAPGYDLSTLDGRLAAIQAGGKPNCLVLDYAGNIKRLGPINDPVLPRKKGSKAGDAPVKICDQCGVYNHASARVCVGCGREFKFEGAKLFRTADTTSPIRTIEPEVHYFNVDRVIYHKHEKKDRTTGEALSPPSMKVSYFCGLQMFKEFVNFESKSQYPQKLAREWWRKRQTDLDEPPLTTDEALQKALSLRVPARIRVQVNSKYPQILGVEF